ncbi:MAG: aspartate-semialdehyde dehydrogenase [candidate division KSB1 bacterium]|nr:aspartate-semialdehyde dehydrogenase [candidate division KSB1 bacterium]
MKKIKCAVLGATGVVGQNFLRLLVDHPYFELTAICASEARKGLMLATVKEQIKGGIPESFEDMLFDPIDIDLLLSKGVQVVFSALPSDVAGDIETEAAEKGLKVFSNAGAHRMDENVPILIPELNYKHLDLVKNQNTEGFIVTNANCTTTGLTLSLLPIRQFGIKRLIVASYQAISGAGYPGLSAVDIISNVIPYIKNEEPKLRAECTKICGDFQGSIKPVDWEVYAHCVRVQTIIGHLISVHAEVEQDVDHDAVAAAMQSVESPNILKDLPTAPHPPVVFTEEYDRPQPRYDIELGWPERAKGMAAKIGRLEVEKNTIRYITLSNNLVRGAAGGSVLNAELAAKKGLV